MGGCCDVGGEGMVIVTGPSSTTLHLKNTKKNRLNMQATKGETGSSWGTLSSEGSIADKKGA